MSNVDQIMSVDEVMGGLIDQNYMASSELALAIRNAMILNKPILLEGPPGVGKTELAKAVSKFLGSSMIRLQCSPEINERRALYDFNYAKQILFVQVLKDNAFIGNGNLQTKIADFDDNNPFYSERFLVKRPIFQAFFPDDGKRKVLLIDELDKSDEEFEFSLLEAFSDYTISIPELGTFEAKVPPLTIITSNRRRKLTDTFLRRCLYLYLEYPSVEQEAKIIEMKTNANPKLALQIAKVIQKIRMQPDIVQQPSVAESIEWATVLKLHCDGEASKEILSEYISVIAKHPNDRIIMRKKVAV